MFLWWDTFYMSVAPWIIDEVKVKDKVTWKTSNLWLRIPVIPSRSDLWVCDPQYLLPYVQEFIHTAQAQPTCYKKYIRARYLIAMELPLTLLLTSCFQIKFLFFRRDYRIENKKCFYDPICITCQLLQGHISWTQSFLRNFAIPLRYIRDVWHVVKFI